MNEPTVIRQGQLILSRIKFILTFILVISFRGPLESDIPPIMVIRDNGSPGMFCCLCTVIGALEQYEMGYSSGIEINYGKRGCYFDKSKGLNWWDYYFEPLPTENSSTKKRKLSGIEHLQFAKKAATDMPVDYINYLITNYISLKPKIQTKIRDFGKKHFKNRFVIGVHYRGTDKLKEAPRVSYERINKTIFKIIKDCKELDYIIFLATDEERIVEYLQTIHGEKIVCINAIRSSDGSPVHYSNHSNYEIGEQAILDCYLLSECDFLIRTSSNLSLFSTFLNPKLPAILLNPGCFD